MQLRQAELVRVLHDQGVHVRNVDAGFDNGRADQYLGLATHHAVHDAGEFVLVHLPVGDGHRDIFQLLGQAVGRAVDVLHAVVQIVDLAAALQLSSDRLADDSPVVLHDKSLDRKPVFGRFFDAGHVADAAHGHVQGTGNRGCGERQHVHAPGELFDVLLVGHAEALLLVHHQKPEVFELHVLGEQAVCPDDQVALARFQVLDGFAVLTADAHPAQKPDFHREAEEALHGGLIVLLRQNRGRNQNRRLLSVQDALHHRPEGHLGLSEAHVAAEQAIHRDRGLHVLLDLGGTAELIVRLRIREVLFKFPLPAAVRREGITRKALPLGIEGNQLSRHVLGRALGPGAGLGPFGSAHLRELDRTFLSPAGVLGHHVQLRCGDIEHVRSGVAELDIVLFKPVHLHFDNSGKAADAVGLVDDIVPHGQVGIALNAFSVGGKLFVCFLFVFSADQLRIRQDRKLERGVFDSGGERADTDTAFTLLRQSLHLRPDQHLCAVLIQKFL